MDDTQKSSDRPIKGFEPAPGAAKKAYTKPAFVRERAFETMALSCGKINTTQQQCKSNRKNS